MKKWILLNKLMVTGAIAGAVGGYIYYRLVGCANGTCLISSKPFNSTVYFAVLGGLLFSTFKKKSGNEAKQ
jgi:hypothetical protein